MPEKFSERYGPWAVVAGASDGIGASVARLLGDRGVHVVLVARRGTALEEVAATIPSRTRTLVLDLSGPQAATELAEATTDIDVGLFVYNAGADPNASRFLEKPVDVWNDLVVRNCTTVVGTTHHFAAIMRQRGHGGIVLVTSGAAWAGGSHLAVYGASKAFDLVLAESLWAELSPAGVDVLGMVLGPTDTPAFRKILNGRQLDGMADPDDVARHMLDNLANGPTFPPDPTPFSAIPRRQAVQLMSRGSSVINDD
jgi:short-subunit dehydrogenase